MVGGGGERRDVDGGEQQRGKGGFIRGRWVPQGLCKGRGGGTTEKKP